MQKQHPWESSQAKATADQKEQKSSSHIYLKISWFSPKTFEFFTLSENPEGECPAISLWRCSRTMLPNTPARPPLNGSRITKNSSLKSDWDAVAWAKTFLSCLKTLQCGWIKTILQRRVGQNSSTAVWKTHCQLLQTLDCSCCCQGWHNQLLNLGMTTSSHSARQVRTAFFP